MPCTKCNSDFNVLNWKFKCGDCNSYYCTKCLKKLDGILYCDKCVILLKRPPDRAKLMELRPRDIQEYLHRNNISTCGVVEKRELIEVFCQNPVPVYPKRGAQRLTANFGGSVPNLAAKPQAFLNNLRANVENVINSQMPSPRPMSGTFSATTSPTRDYERQRDRPPRPPPPRTYSQATTSTEHQNSSEDNDFNHQNSKKETTNESSEQPKYPKLSDFGSAEDLNTLSAKQLKELLTLNRVDYRGCVEKSELLERANRLWLDNQQKNEALPDELEDLCKLCMDAPLDCVLLECGHIATCIECGKRLAECPICRQYVIRVVRTFKA